LRRVRAFEPAITQGATQLIRASELTAEFVRGPYQFVELDGGGHFVVDQFPERIARLLLAHVQSVAI
jgi:pimeloyl-ACP methyl ester carboxylesterase